MAETTWFTAQEAKDAGFIDAIVEGKKAQNCWNLSAYGNAPKALEPLPKPDLQPPAITEHEHRERLQMRLRLLEIS